METVKQNKKELFFEIFRYLLVGGIATVFDYAMWFVFFTWILPSSLVGETVASLVAVAMGFAIGLLVNWILSQVFVFRQVKNKQGGKERYEAFITQTSR